MSKEEVLEFCHNAAPEDHISEERVANKVLPLPGGFVVKYGQLVNEHEAASQKRARLLGDLSLVYVPEVVDFFTFSDEGYLIMERIYGDSPSELSQEQYSHVRTMTKHLHSITSNNDIGPLGGGPPQGVLFERVADSLFDSKLSIERCFSKWSGHPLSLHDQEFVLCHMDIAPRNIVWREHDKPCLIDWVGAGWYPRCFEYVVQYQTCANHNSFTREFNKIFHFTEREQLVINNVMRGSDMAEVYHKSCRRDARLTLTCILAHQGRKASLPC